MFDIGLQEMLLVGVIALLVFGPGKLPELGRMVGRAMREFRRASDDFRSTVETNLHLNDPEPVIAPEAPGEPSLGKRGARLFHRRDCAWVARIAEVDRVYMKRAAEAEEQGLTRCPACEPWEPAW